MARVNLLVPGDIRTLTGGYIYDRELAAALTRAGWHVTIREIGERLSLPAARERAARILEALPANAVVIVDGLALAELAKELSRHSRRLRLVALVHHPAALETGLPAATAAALERNELRALQAMRHVVCTSAWTAQQLERHCGAQRGAISVVEPGVDDDLAAADTHGIRREPAVAHAGGLRLLCVATLTPRKGHDTLIGALAQLRELDWSLELIGSTQRAPQHAARIAALIGQHGLEQRVAVRGEVSKEELASAYANADLFVIASRLEGYGMVLAEARAAGLPIIATRGGAVGATLKDAAAFLVEPDSAGALAAALRRVIEERPVWQHLAAAAARDAKTKARSWAQVADEFAAILESSLDDE